MRLAWPFAATLLLSGCLPDIGLCTTEAEDQALTIVYLDDTDDVVLDGLPAYAGQALVELSCGNGAFCHAGEEASNRYGAPGNYSFDVRIACPDPASCSTPAIDRLHDGQLDLYRLRRRVLGEVQNGDMPPGARGREVRARYEYRLDADPMTSPRMILPEIDSPEGEDILRSWLACGAPVVERSVAEDTGGLGPGELCNVEGREEVGDCRVRFGTGEVVPDPNWDSIYENVIGPRCGDSCHGPTIPDEFMRSDLDLRDADTAYDALVDVVAAGEDCMGMSLTLVEPGMPASSLLIEKLREMDPTCGRRMPSGGPYLGEEVIAAIETWIMMGAMR